MVSSIAYCMIRNVRQISSISQIINQNRSQYEKNSLKSIARELLVTCKSEYGEIMNHRALYKDHQLYAQAIG